MLRHEIAMELFLQIGIRPNLIPVPAQPSQALLCPPSVHTNTIGLGARTY
jgi:hypothetical protein